MSMMVRSAFDDASSARRLNGGTTSVSIFGSGTIYSILTYPKNLLPLHS